MGKNGFLLELSLAFHARVWEFAMPKGLQFSSKTRFLNRVFQEKLQGIIRGGFFLYFFRVLNEPWAQKGVSAPGPWSLGMTQIPDHEARNGSLKSRVLTFTPSKV